MLNSHSDKQVVAVTGFVSVAILELKGVANLSKESVNTRHRDERSDRLV